MKRNTTSLPDQSTPKPRTGSYCRNATRIEMLPIRDLRPNPNNARTHSRQQVEEIACSIDQFGFNNPVLVDSNNHILAGHGRVEAAKMLGLARIPALRIEHLSAAEKRAYVLADNKLAEKAGWAKEILTIELQELINLDFDVELTGFSAGEIDAMLGAQDSDEEDADDVCPEHEPSHAVTRAGDCWRAGPHLLFCGDARDQASYKCLMAGQKAAYAITDPPYNIRIDQNAVGHGRVRFREFAFASGEMSQARTQEPVRLGQTEWRARQLLSLPARTGVSMEVQPRQACEQLRTRTARPLARAGAISFSTRFAVAARSF